MKRLIMAMALACLAACASANTRQFSETTTTRPAAGSKILIVQPDISLALLTATGLQQPRADWSQQGRDNLAADIKAAITARGHTAEAFDPSASMDGRIGQILRLNQAVSSSIQFASYGPIPLPTEKEKFTVLRSPHVNKKSREQFQLCTYKRLVDIYSNSAKTVDALMKLELPSGVDVEIKV